MRPILLAKHQMWYWNNNGIRVFLAEPSKTMIVTIIKKVKRSFTAEISSDFVFFLSISKYIKQKWKTFSCYTLQIFSHYWRNRWRQSAKVFANVNRISRLWWLALTTWNPFEKKKPGDSSGFSGMWQLWLLRRNHLSGLTWFGIGRTIPARRWQYS